jgi:hypothetical protein
MQHNPTQKFLTSAFTIETIFYSFSGSWIVRHHFLRQHREDNKSCFKAKKRVLKQNKKVRFSQKCDWSEMFRFLSKRYSRRKRSGGIMMTSSKSNSYSPAKVGDVVHRDSNEVQVVPLQVKIYFSFNSKVFCLSLISCFNVITSCVWVQLMFFVLLNRCFEMAHLTNFWLVLIKIPSMWFLFVAKIWTLNLSVVSPLLDHC